ncbi:hypothetical protein FOMA001_g5607 [Fusarium oxysporum f. sp. matthiolae]|nr:hypothetical protein FOMA001_g5607 [Fusarium oxysporum f. sp. matthiolae]
MHSRPICKLHTVPIHKAPRYKALSYCWGLNQSKTSILLNGKEFSVTENLLEALETLQKEPGFYWVDAICINQADLQERGLQVNRMKTIFSTAEQVVVWLGGNVQLAFLYPTTAEITQPDEGRSSFFGNAYWRRVWVVQEFAVSTSVIILYQNGRITWNELLWFMESPSVVGRNVNTVSQDWEGVECITRLISLRQGFIRCSPVYLLDLLRRSRSLLATDKLDKVYGLLGLAHDGDRFVRYPQYGISPRTLYKRMATSLLEKTENLYILCLRHDLKDDYLPSWVPQWFDLHDIRSRDWIGYMIRRSTLPDVGPLVYDLPRVQGNVLSVRGKVIDVLTSLTTPCYAGGSSRASHEVPTISESRSNPYGCDDNIYFAIVKSLCFGLNLFGSSLTNHIIDQKMDISKLLRTRLSCWTADNEDFQVGGKGLPSWTRETYGDILRTNSYLLRDSPFVTNLLIRSLGLSPEVVARLTTPSDDVLRFYKEVDDGLYTFSAAQMRLTITEQGLIGVVMSEASQGDTLVRFEGCERLIVVREAIRNNDRWVVVGEGWLCTDHTRFSEDESELRWFDIV